MNIDELIEMVELRLRIFAMDPRNRKLDEDLITALRELQARIAELESTVEAYRENRAGQYKRQRDAAIQLAEDCCAMSVDEEIERIRGMK